jgi:8-oxo-dGTP pyrophosphatase MutT (NUDIX family)
MPKSELLQNVKLLQKAIIIDQSGKILALRRSKDSFSRAQKWDIPGGNLDKADILESYIQSGKGDQGDILIKSIAREIVEETGIEIDLKEVKPISNASGYNLEKEIFTIALVYICNLNITEPKIQLSSEHSEYVWLLKNDFQKLDVGDDGGLIMSAAKRI